MAYSIDSTAADCYPGTTCLINKLGIQDETILAEKEAAEQALEEKMERWEYLEELAAKIAGQE